MTPRAGTSLAPRAFGAQRTALGSDLHVRLSKCLQAWLSPITADSVVRSACKRLSLEPRDLSQAHLRRIAELLPSLLRLYLDPPDVPKAVASLKDLDAHETPTAGAEDVALPIESEVDLIRARTAARNRAIEVGLDPVDAIKVATVVSELARNILQYAGRGSIELRNTPQHPGVEVVAHDNGPGIADLEQVLSPHYRSKTGMGLGLKGSQRLMDAFQITTHPGQGVHVIARKHVPR